MRPGTSIRLDSPVKLGLTRGSIRGGALAVIGTVVASLAIAAPAHAATATLFASPTGSGDACSATQPCALPTAKERVRDLAAASGADITVELADGEYNIDAPLEFRAEDGGREGSTVRYVAAAGAEPVISGASDVTGWTLHDEAKNSSVCLASLTGVGVGPPMSACRVRSSGCSQRVIATLS
jgi:hypothetical protein